MTDSDVSSKAPVPSDGETEDSHVSGFVLLDESGNEAVTSTDRTRSTSDSSEDSIEVLPDPSLCETQETGPSHLVKVVLKDWQIIKFDDLGIKGQMKDGTILVDSHEKCLFIEIENKEGKFYLLCTLIIIQ